MIRFTALTSPAQRESAENRVDCDEMASTRGILYEEKYCVGVSSLYNYDDERVTLSHRDRALSVILSGQ